MKINDQILSIPPYISTSWKNINSILVDKEGNLIVLLTTNNKIVIPNITKPTINNIFNAHSKYLENDVTKNDVTKNDVTKNNDLVGFPLKIGLDGVKSLGSAMQHNPSQANAPNLPEDILKKIASISKIVGMDDSEAMLKPEPNCNCIYCQITRAMKGEKKEEEMVTDEDLKFRLWDVDQTDEKLYNVTNPLDKNEKYTVFLGKPLGCTCGQKNCEHIRAVLNS